MAFPHPRGGGAPQVGTVRIRAAAPSATGNRSGPTRHRRSSTWATSGLFCSGQSSPDTQYPSGCGLTQREHPAVPPDTTLSPRPFPSGPTALGLRSFPPRPTRPPPRTPGKSASPGKSAGQENPPARNIRRPGTSFAREIRLNREIHRPDPHSTRHPSCPALSRSALLHRHVSRPFPPRRNTCRASPLPPNGMPHEPRRGRPRTNLQAGPDAPTKRAATRRGCRSPTIGFGSDYLLLSWL